MWICERKWSDFWAYHPELKPFMIRVYADYHYHEQLEICMAKLLYELKLTELSESGA